MEQKESLEERVSDEDLGIKEIPQIPKSIKTFDKVAIGTSYVVVIYALYESGSRLIEFAHKLNEQIGISDPVFHIKDFLYVMGPALCAVPIARAIPHILRKVRKAYVNKSQEFKENKLKRRDEEAKQIGEAKQKKVLPKHTQNSIKINCEEFSRHLRLMGIQFVKMFNQKKGLSLYESMKSKYPDYIPVRIEEYLHHKSQRNYEETVFSIIDILRKIRKRDALFERDSTAARHNLEAPFAIKDFFYHIDRLFTNFSFDPTGLGAFNYLQKHHDSLLETPEKKILVGMIVQDYLAETPRVHPAWIQFSNSLWAKAISEIESDSMTREEKLVHSKNKITVFGPSPVLSGMLVNKSSPNHDFLLSEMKRLEEMNKILLEYPNYFVPRAIHLTSVPKDGLYTLIMRRKEGKLLQYCKPEDVEKAADYLAIIHKKLSHPKETRDYKQLINQRILDSEYDFLKPIVNEWSFLFDSIIGDFVFDKDAHGRNWIVGEEGITALDFEHKDSAHQEYDLNKLIEQYHRIGFEEKIRVLKTYFSRFGVKDTPERIKGYLSASFPAAVNHFIFTSEYNIGDNSTRRNFLENAKRNMVVLNDPRTKPLQEYAERLICTL